MGNLARKVVAIKTAHIKSIDKHRWDIQIDLGRGGGNRLYQSSHLLTVLPRDILHLWIVEVSLWDHSLGFCKSEVRHSCYIIIHKQRFLPYLIVTSDFISPTRGGNEPLMELESRSKVWRLDRLIKEFGNVDVKKLRLRRRSRKFVSAPNPCGMWPVESWLQRSQMWDIA